MLPRFTAFISSTVRDFHPARRDLKTWLQTRGIDVRLSEDPEFPVDDGVTSHEACLRALEGAHLFILLVGTRYGGRYLDTRQSITWREYDEALRLHIPAVVLVLEEVNHQAQQLADARKAGTAAPPTDLSHDLVAFIDHLRKGHPDNWAHLDWDGSFTHARTLIDTRINALFVRYQDPHRELRAKARRLELAASARLQLDEMAALTAETAEGSTLADLLNPLLGTMALHREALFGMEADERFNFAVYQRTDDELRVAGRFVHPDIPRRDRAWPVGHGHAGLAVAESRVLVSPNLAFTDDWQRESPDDDRNYVSAVSVPLWAGSPAGGEPQGVFVVTSDRQDRFKELEQPEVLTARSLAYMISSVIAAYERMLR